jgi:hypothetical protein
MILGKSGANHWNPNPFWVRDHNSPVASAMRRLRSHHADLGRAANAVNSLSQLRSARLRSQPDRKPRLRVFTARRCGSEERRTMKDRISITKTDARQATKEGVVRYVLLISLVLVAVLFAGAYIIFR